ncbi:MAG: phosphatase PAP2 family protein [Betaproteobacteria bacterium]|nr:phosphatase PAP2 family protein [Betaproteobacteria bacterium]
MKSLVLKSNKVSLFSPILIALVLLTLILLLQINRELFLFLHHFLRGSVPGFVWETLTFMGDAGVTPLIMIFFIRRRPELIWATLWASLIAYLLSHGLKPVVNELRPPAVLDHLDVLGPVLKYSSFPSGHATTIFTCIGLLTLGVPTSYRITLLLWVFGILVALSRIAVGVHWPIDVLAGLVIGWASALIGLWLSQTKINSPQSRFYWLPLAVFFILVMYNLFGQPYGFQDLWLVQKVIAILFGLLWIKQTRDWYSSH